MLANEELKKRRKRLKTEQPNFKMKFTEKDKKRKQIGIYICKDKFTGLENNSTKLMNKILRS